MEGVPEKSRLDEIEWNGGVLCPAGRGLARIIHERFYYNRGFAAATSLHAAAAACRRAGSPLSRSTYRSPVALPEQRVPGTPPPLVGHAGYPLLPGCNGCNATRLCDFATNRHG